MSEQVDRGVVIVGAGQAAADLTGALRQQGYTGPITLIGDESYPPYRRPPLSKGFLIGEVTLESLYCKAEETYARQRIECRYGIGVERIDRDSQSVRLYDGLSIQYEHLVIATGGRSRRLSLTGADHANVHYVRTIDDILKLKGQLISGARLLVVGGGFIGLEAAAVGIRKGLEVTLVEALPRLLARVTGPEVSGFYERAHRARGVKIRTGVGVHALEGEQLVEAVVLSDGTRLKADVVIVGIGIIPNTELADACGLDIGNGILVDSQTRTCDPTIYAIGDCCNHNNAFLGKRVRLESVPSASDQARTCAMAICGKPAPQIAAPWFWSDQYDMKLQIVGLSHDYEEVAIRGDLSKESFCAFYLKGGVIISADVVIRSSDFMVAKRLVTNRVRAAVAKLEDEGCALKSLEAV